MVKGKVINSSDPPRRTRPALTPEADENQMISLAMDLVKKRLIAGTASSQETTHFLKMGSPTQKLERQILVNQNKLLEAKTQALQSAQHVEELYTNALNAMRNYSGQGTDDDDEEDE